MKNILIISFLFVLNIGFSQTKLNATDTQILINQTNSEYCEVIEIFISGMFIFNEEAHKSATAKLYQISNSYRNIVDNGFFEETEEGRLLKTKMLMLYYETITNSSTFSDANIIEFYKSDKKKKTVVYRQESKLISKDLEDNYNYLIRLTDLVCEKKN